MIALLTIKAAAKASNIGYGTLRRVVKDGLITVVMLPGQRTPMLDPADIDRWIQSLKSGGVPGVILDIGSSQASDVVPVPTRTERAKLPYYERFKPKVPQPLKVRVKA